MQRREFLHTMSAFMLGPLVSPEAIRTVHGALTPLTSPGAGDNRATYLPDGAAILFASNRTGRSQMWIMDVDGRNPRRLHESGANDYGRIAPNPDGTRLSFSSDRSGNNAVYVLDRQRGTVTPISDLGFWSFGPSWSSRDRIAYFSRQGGDRLNLWTARPDGSDSRQVTDQPGDSRQPWWSPDGAILAFAANAGTETFGLWLAAADGARAHALTSIGDWQQPFWGPDGRRLAASAKLGSESSQIVILTSDGASVQRIPQPGGDNVHPAWSPDGRSIVFTAGRDHQGALWRFDFSA